MSERNKLIVVVFSVATIAMLVFSCLLPVLVQDHLNEKRAEDKPVSKSTSMDSHVLKPGQQVGGAPSDVCEKLAPRTLQAYMTMPRKDLKGVWLTPNAQGLEIPISAISKQPLKDFSGALSGGSQYSTAVCTVWTGLESPWLLQYRYDGEDGWLAVMVQGPSEGAYDTSGEVNHGVR